MPLNRRNLLLGSVASLPLLRSTHGAAGPFPNVNPDPQDHNDPHLHLLVDDDELQSVKHLQRIVNQPRKRPQPILSADRPWEGERAQAWGSVIQEPDGLFRMWYFAMNTERRWDELDVGGYCYAESRDGVNWEKPDLGTLNFRGTSRNNLFYSCAPDRNNLVERMSTGFKVVPTVKQQRALQRLERAALQGYNRKVEEDDKETLAYRIEQAIDARVGRLQRENRRALEMILNAVGNVKR